MSRPQGKTLDAIRQSVASACAGGRVLYLAPNSQMIKWALQKVLELEPTATVNLTRRRASFPSGGFLDFAPKDDDVVRYLGLSLSHVEVDCAVNSPEWDREIPALTAPRG